ncbi:peptidase C65 Otubain-domain-containing protein [Protomyces lactucae-debilis]|uniref:Peptidase C65 Otubain-domain-containing protein n=1 Tax=Protomyces lactucae-debilis TaxID=2754530 RepID=A0A1Y2EUT8_PROLT|nr:peptidase C65 Otubain-domain-containing protein [Protomyces lactucae-debilis]ORY74615.1 peptidase C65 Otubain-domain-containing protein [Protomyces lactucae-debilis]
MSAPVEDERPTDEAILSFAQQVQQEAIDQLPLLSQNQPISVLAAEYAHGNPAFLQKIAALGQHARYYKTRGDGNCFYRAWLFSLFSQVRTSGDDAVAQLDKNLKACAHLLDAAGFVSIVYEDFLETTIELLHATDLHASINDPEISNAAVVYIRFVTSAYIKQHAESYMPYLDEGEVLPRWCERWVEAMDAEADHLQINGLVNALHVGVDIVYLDRSAGDEATVHQVRPDEGDAVHVVKLLYRPGHYDVLTLPLCCTVNMYLSRKNLDNLKLYKYSAIDNSPVSKYILKPFWNKFLLLFPMWLAPNMITLLGLLFVVANVLQLLYYDPGLEHGVPPWVSLGWAVSLFLYQAFDAVDGMQARRTGQSSPLGEMFDHGCDALNTTLEVLLTASTINLHQSWWAIASQFATTCNFYLTTWEEYHTGTLYLSAFSGPVEGILLVVGLHTITALYGPTFWDQRVVDKLGVASFSLVKHLPSFLRDAELKHVFLYFGGIALIANIFGSSVNVIAARRKNNLPLAPALSGLIPFFLSSGITMLFAWLNPTVVTEQCVPFLFFLGILFAYSVGLMITAHITHAPFPYFTPYFLLFPMLAGIAFNHKIGAMEARDIVWLSLGLSLGIHGSFVVDVIKEITQHLDIWCLAIKHPQAKKTS